MQDAAARAPGIQVLPTLWSKVFGVLGFKARSDSGHQKP